MKIYLIRHGETDWNAKRLLQGSIDRSINSVGRAQAEALAEELSHKGITAIYSSNLARAKQTANIVARRLGVPVTIDTRLRECSFGKFEGKSLEHLKKYFKEYFRGSEHPYNFSPVGGDCREEVLKRQLEFLDEIKKDKECLVALIVGHGTSLNTILADLDYPAKMQRGEIREIDY